MLTVFTETMESNNVNQNGRTTISVIGCERIGILHACLLVEEGFRVTCVDNDRATVERVSKGKVPFLKQEIEPIIRKSLEDGKMQVSCNLEDAVQSDVVLVTIPTTINEKGKVDYSNIEKTLKRLGSNLQRGILIINTSVVGVGVTEGILKETLESSSGFKSGLDFHFAYSPVPFPKEQTLKTLACCRRVVAAQDKVSLEKASDIMGVITKAEIIKSLNVKATEAAALFEALHRKVDSALANEFAIFCEKVGVDYVAVQGLFSQQTNAFLPKIDDGKSEEALILLEEAENQNVRLKISQAALELNKESIKHGVSLVQDALKNCGKPMRRVKIAILGFSQTRNTADIPKNSLKNFVKVLERKGAKLALYDPYLSLKTTSIELPSLERSLTEAVEGADCIIIYTGHDQFKRLNLRKIKLLAKMPAAVVDFEGILDPVTVKAEGFVYHGLGRGALRNE